MTERTYQIDLEYSKWNQSDFRNIKRKLLTDVQRKLQEFEPVSKESYQDNCIQLLDLFCGAGGTSLGFAALNQVIPSFKMLGGCDINSVSAHTYSYNFGTPAINEDITKLAYEEGKLEELLTEIGYDHTLPLVLIGCAPCQGFSSHGKKRWGEEDDDRNNLIIAFAEIVKKLNPEVIIMENVPEFLSKRYWDYFSAAKKKYEECGYTVKQCIHNAASFGVP